MNIVDSHNHIHFRAFGHDREEALNRAYDGGVTSMLTVGIDPDDCKKALDVARVHKGVFASIGIHPQNADKYGVKEVQLLAGLCNDPCVVAIGETGFDLFRTPESEPRQKELFAAHIELARQLRLPLVIHDRQAHEQTLQVMNDTKAWPIGGVFHCFSGDTQLARTVIGNGFFISIPGVVSFKNAQVLKDVVDRTPLEFLLVETDAPYLTPEPFRGKRNEPLYVVKVVDEIARIKKTSAEEVARVTSENFSRLFLGHLSKNAK
jgi:TatD DNase family protein